MNLEVKKRLYICILVSIISLFCSSCKRERKVIPFACNFVQEPYYAQIDKENYENMYQPFTIKYINHNHWYYNSKSEPFIVGDCGLYAVIRALRHLGQYGYIDPNLWKKFSIQQLREILVQNGGINDDIIKPRTWLDAFDILRLLDIFRVYELIDVVCNDNPQDAGTMVVTKKLYESNWMGKQI